LTLYHRRAVFTTCASTMSSLFSFRVADDPADTV
jgi:hypothetical protein